MDSIKKTYLLALHEYLYCNRMLSSEGQNCYRIYSQLVRQNPLDSQAWNGLGQCYQYGYGTARHVRCAKRAYRKAAKLGHVEAQQSLGNLYEFADKPNYRRARKWYIRATAQRSLDATDAIYRLGYLYEKGLGGKKDIQAALIYYRMAAKMGNADAQNALAYCYDKGLGVRQCYAKALKWYKKAVIQEFPHETACSNIGRLLHYGYGVKQDKQQAKKWYKLAIHLGSIAALYNLGRLYEDMGKLNKAAHYYQRAISENGDKAAKKRLNKLRKQGFSGCLKQETLNKESFTE